MMKRSALVFGFLVAFASYMATPAFPQDFDAGKAAYDRGDFDSAVEEFLPLGEQGNAKAQFALGVMYQFGKGVSQNHPGAVRWYRLAAEQGHARAQYHLGEMYGTGSGVPQNFVESARWYRFAAEQGNEWAQLRLATAYSEGKGVAQSFPEAVRWSRVAAQKGNAKAQALLGLLYLDPGTPRDNVASHMWLNIAATNGDEIAQTVRSTYEESMTAEEIAEAQRRAEACMSSSYATCD